MASLNRLASNWSRVEREKLNTNWSIIENYLSNLQRQINLLTGDVNVQELIDKINDIFNQGNVIIGDLEAALQDASIVITNAQNATTDANNAAQDALNAINDMRAFINQFGNAETYDNSKLYKINNIVELNGSGFICIQNTQGNQPPTLPTKRNDWWQLIAQRGVDGNGAVSKVAGKSPDVDGNVPLTTQDIGAVGSDEFNAIKYAPKASYRATESEPLLHETWGRVLWNVKLIDTSSFVDTTVPTKIKIPESGMYLITVNVNMPSGQGVRNMKLVKNGTEDFAYASNLGTYINVRCSISTLHYFNTNEYFEVSVYQDSNAAAQIVVGGGLPNLAIAKLGDIP